MRLTSARKIVLDILAQDCRHWTAQDIYAEASKRLHSLNPSTVYRALDYLCSVGLVSVSDIGNGSPVYETVSDERHHHIVCLSCHQITTLPDEKVSAFFNRMQEEFGFQVRTNHLVLFGLCRECAADHRQDQSTEK